MYPLHQTDHSFSFWAFASHGIKLVFISKLSKIRVIYICISKTDRWISICVLGRISGVFLEKVLEFFSVKNDYAIQCQDQYCYDSECDVHKYCSFMNTYLKSTLLAPNDPHISRLADCTGPGSFYLNFIEEETVKDSNPKAKSAAYACWAAFWMIHFSHCAIIPPQNIQLHKQIRTYSCPISTPRDCRCFKINEIVASIDKLLVSIFI